MPRTCSLELHDFSINRFFFLLILIVFFFPPMLLFLRLYFSFIDINSLIILNNVEWVA